MRQAARVIDFRPSPAPVSTPVEAEPVAPWPRGRPRCSTDAEPPPRPSRQSKPTPTSPIDAPRRRSSSRRSRSCLTRTPVRCSSSPRRRRSSRRSPKPRPEPSGQRPRSSRCRRPSSRPRVDVGANSAHLLVAAVTGHLVEPLLDESAFLGLGDRVATHGYLGADARDELVATLAGYADAARSLGASSVTFVGTEPVRRAADAAPLDPRGRGPGQCAAPRPRPRRGGEAHAPRRDRRQARRRRSSSSSTSAAAAPSSSSWARIGRSPPPGSGSAAPA